MTTRRCLSFDRRRMGGKEKPWSVRIDEINEDEDESDDKNGNE